MNMTPSSCKEERVMRKSFNPQRVAKMHKEAEELLIAGRKRIAEGRSDFLGLNRPALSASSAVKLFSSSASFFVSSCAFSWP
jgi:hypothetical protein